MKLTVQTVEREEMRPVTVTEPEFTLVLSKRQAELLSALVLRGVRWDCSEMGNFAHELSDALTAQLVSVAKWDTLHGTLPTWKKLV